jgi:MFS family permease
MPIEIGGLGLPPKSIGLILGAYGLTTGLFQVVFFARMIHRFGERHVFFFFFLSVCDNEVKGGSSSME